MWELKANIAHFGKSSSLWGGHFVVDDAVAQDIKSEKIKRLVCTINNQEKIHCALQSMGNGTYYILVNKTLQKKLKVVMGDLLEIKLEPDTSKYGIPMPEEMAEILVQDKLVDALFHSLTPGKQRSILYQIGVPKTIESRVKKAILITRYLVEVNGKIDFLEMNEYVKINSKIG